MTRSDHADELERIAATSGRNTLDVLEFFLERAAIRQYDGSLSRDEAELGAMDDVRKWGLQPSQHASSTGGES